MPIENVLKLLNAGFSADEIRAMQNNPPPAENPVDNVPANNPPPAENPADNVPANNPPPVDNWQAQMWQTMQKLAETQSKLLAIQQHQQVNLADGGEPPKPVNVDDFLASIINPPTK